MTEPENSSQDWQLKCNETHERLGHLLSTKLWADCTFLVGDEDPVSITAHKLVLAMSSPVFDTMFNGSMPEGKDPIRVPDVQPEAFNRMLKYLYTDTAKLRSYQEASEVYCAAKKYMLPFIQKNCVEYLQWNLTSSNACFAHEFANLFDEKKLLKSALKTFKRKTKDVLKEGSFYEAHINTVVALFSQQELDINSELDLFKALERYSAETMGLKSLKRSSHIYSECSPRKRPRIENNENQPTLENDGTETKMAETCEKESEDEKRLISELRQALGHIRFLTLSAKQFAVAAQTVLMTDEEAHSVMLNLAGVNVPIPSTICSSTERRGVRHWSPDYAGPSTSTPQKEGQSPQASLFEAMCTFTVCNFKTRKRPVKSQPFYTDSLEWHVNIVPGTERQPNAPTEQKILGVYVECAHATSKSWICAARVTIDLVSCNPARPNLHRTFTNVYNFNTMSNGYRNLVPWSVVVDNYLRSNSLKVDVRVVSHITI